jgi:hypothetical protein
MLCLTFDVVLDISTTLSTCSNRAMNIKCKSTFHTVSCRVVIRAAMSFNLTD